MDSNSVKNIFLKVCKACGLFFLSRFLTRKGLRILCYHGFNLDDEANFRPKLYMPVEQFEKRLDFLQDHHFPILSLTEAMKLQAEGKLPSSSTVITIDDGWYSTYVKAYPALQLRKAPATLYVTSYYFTKGTPVFPVCIGYLLWKTKKISVDFSRLGVPTLGEANAISLILENQKSYVENQIISYGISNCDESERCKLARNLAELLEVDYDRLCERRKLSMVNGAELKEMVHGGIDVQLHTHRHQFPINSYMAEKEIEENRIALEDFSEKGFQHFCYPSGLWSHQHWPILNQANIQTATTCIPGLVYRTTPRFALKRILDHSLVSALDFEAEMSGFKDLLRKLGVCLGLRSKNYEEETN